MSRPAKGSPEAKEWAAKMKAARAAKETNTTQTEEAPAQTPQVTLTQEQFQQILDRMEKLESAAAAPQAPAQASTGVHIGPQGQISGVIERFPLSTEFYPNPVEELLATPSLRRFALRENYELRYKFSKTSYQTAQGTWYADPRFELTLLKNDYNEDGSIKRKIVFGRASFFEDPPANIEEAELAGLDPNAVDPREFADKMRMWRFRFWLEDTLLNIENPKRALEAVQQQQKSKLQVIGGKAYEVEEYSTAA